MSVAAAGSRDLVRRLSLKTAPVLEPLSVPDAIKHLKDPPAGEEPLIEALIAAARGHAERVANLQLITATWTLKCDRFPSCGEEIEIPVRPLLTVVSVKYRDSSDVLTTWASSEYVIDAPVGEYPPTGRIYLALNKSYPATATRPDAVEIELTAGYGLTPETVPNQIRQAMLLMIGHWYANRETVSLGEVVAPTDIPWSTAALLTPFQRLAGLIR